MMRIDKVVVPQLIKLNFNNLSIHYANYRHDHDAICNVLVDDISANGQHETVKVVEQDGKYFVIDGWKRAVALNSLNLAINCEIITNTMSAISKYIMTPNVICRSDFEIFMSLKAIVEVTNLSHDAVGKLCGFSKHKMYNFFCFDKIFPEVLEAIGDMQGVTASTAKAVCNEQKNGHRKARVARSFIEDFGSCQNRITTLADGFASDAHLRTDLPKNKPTVSFLKASTAYMALRAGKYLPASKGRSATHNLSMEPKGSPSEDYSTSASPLPVSQRLIALSKCIREGTGSTTLRKLIKSHDNEESNADNEEDTSKAKKQTLEIKNKSGDVLAEWSGTNSSITLKQDISLDDKDLIGEIVTQAIRAFYSTINKKTLEKKHDEKYGNKYGGAEIVSIPRQVA